MLFDAVKSVQEETTMFKHLLGDIKSALDSLQPPIKDIEKYNSKEGLEYFAIQIEEGANLLACGENTNTPTSFVNWSFKSLRRVFDALKVQGIRDARLKVQGISA
ncbi:hypothetical protein DVH24_012930 [Malus domestica]|uniref:RPW8 domain-containing protein n=1 Tax=Malus domestica TaxID=3750 RepID=A0A498HP65_MALDO|nr:hypothetical protein DVH24_012930 [Malus domestica]